MIPIFNPKQDDIFHLLKFLLLGSNFQFHLYGSCMSLLSLFPGCFFTCFLESFLKIIYLIYYFYIFISACYFPISALNSICDYFSSILMSYEGKHASCNNDCHMVVAVGDLEIVKA